MNARNNTVDGRPGLTNKINPLDHLRCAFVYQGLDFLSGFSGPMCQTAHFCCDDGKAFPGFPSARGFNACIQCKKVRLECDVVNHTDNCRDLP